MCEGPKQTLRPHRPSPRTASTPAAPVLTSAPFSQDPHVDRYETKEWTFVIENVSD